MLSFAVVAIGAAAYFGINTMNSSNTSLMMKNVEALAAGEGVHIPCRPAMDICTFNIIDANGTPGALSVDYSVKQ